MGLFKRGECPNGRIFEGYGFFPADFSLTPKFNSNVRRQTRQLPPSAQKTYASRRVWTISVPYTFKTGGLLWSETLYFVHDQAF
jgi:hypothetical protein